MGPSVLVSFLMSSILQFPCSSTPTPVRVLTELKKIITDFFWSNKRGMVAYNVLVQDIQNGGLKLPDLTTRIQTTHIYWIKFIWDHPDSVMASFLKHFKHSTSGWCTGSYHAISSSKTYVSGQMTSAPSTQPQT